MKMILPDALFIGFTGTLIKKKDKQKKSIEIFGPYIGNPYKFDEAVEDGVVWIYYTKPEMLSNL
jgi:type I restriction enzyme R subunit